MRVSASEPKLFFFLLVLFFVGQANAQDLVLSGVIVTPDKVLDKGWVVIKGGRIFSIVESAPDRASGPTIDTNGIIFPGFVDLHDHPMYNIFKRWTPKAKFKNRLRMARSAGIQLPYRQTWRGTAEEGRQRSNILRHR